ncbi:PrsW family intramembrane metalloprotease [Rathayibacter oskolensis]|nr:PrsW family intramembrane metalloprotease [Rathayibacter oskolensis]WKK71029.1 PrsW family intramembrane metalloprotease [Rathayibacter oskolensis]
MAIALLVDLGVQIAVYASGAQPSESDFVGAVIQAPLVEETAKGLGVLLVLLIWRRSFDGPVDGIVYAAVVASGFAFVENILYFGSALVEGGLGSLAVTFFLRGVLSPFAHVLFTACTERRWASRRAGPPRPPCRSRSSVWRSPRSCTRCGTARRSSSPTGSASTESSRCRCSSSR